VVPSATPLAAIAADSLTAAGAVGTISSEVSVDIKRIFLAALAAGIFLGCYATLGAFDKRMAKLGCINLRECYPDDFAEEFSSLGDCTDEVRAELDEQFAGCSYDASKGRACVHATYRKRKDCSLLDGGGDTPECHGTVTCLNSAPDDGSLTHQILHGFVSPGPAPANAVPIDQPIDLDPEIEQAIDDLE